MIIAIVIAAAVLILIGTGLIGGASRDRPGVPVRRDQELHRRVRSADAEVHAEYRAARRAMNIAAGQSWRNLVD
ncbi:hypothetical protein [Gordonia aichiensis]|uniref:Uncharacterized protein n=1 Tax=Gordonia aichiensis NBRC 108223 TaxID=1220583 RepID=L7KTI3_9ACTN|nr:hypothetical protein [Gordonia aichiensis]GAC50993.1 hypothetical protein GOACH_36_00150 [Gordonia aichiensis NBRC 108223]